MQSVQKEYLTHILVKKSNKKIFVDVNKIDWVESSGNYLKLHLGQNSHLVRGALNTLEERLSGSQFLRIHSSYIVNVSEIDSLKSRGSGDYKVKLKNGKELNMSRNYKEALNRFTVS